jgi:hypothetical protein
MIRQLLKKIYDKITYSQTQKEIEKAFVKSDLRNDKKKLLVLKEILQAKQLCMPFINNEMNCEAICFSKDRALQLHALLLSYFKYVTNPVKIYILYTYSNDRHRISYETLIKLFNGYNISFIKENNFKNDLENLLAKIKSEKCFFMTDDALFIEEIDLHDFIKFNPSIAIPSLTKGLDLTYCFSYARNQALPRFIVTPELGPDRKCWNWADASESPDWAYPLSVDATLFDKVEIEILIRNTPYKAPNTLESNLQYYLDLFIYRKGVCFEKVKYVNVPCNMVQTEFSNKTTGEYDADFLLKQWEEGNRIYFEEFYKQDCKLVQKARYNFVKR